MARARQPKLKVFQAQFGFLDTVVAAPNQAEALRAWGTHQNLFTRGEARVTQDEAAVAAALRHPGTPLRRAIGSSDAFTLEPASSPEVPDVPERAAARPSAKAKPARPSKPPADRSALDAAEAALRDLDDARKRQEAELRRRREALDGADAEARRAYVDGRKAATAAVAEALRAYRMAGGKD